MKRRIESLEVEEPGSEPVERLTCPAIYPKHPLQRPVLGAPKPYPIRRPSAGADYAYPSEVARQSLTCNVARRLTSCDFDFMPRSVLPHPSRLMPIESQQYINISDEFSPARLTYHPSTSAAGDTSTVNAKGSYSVINGSAPPINATTLHSELFYHRNMTVNQNSIALSSDRGSLEIAGVSLLYEGSRVKSYLLGRDLNPMGTISNAQTL